MNNLSEATSRISLPDAPPAQESILAAGGVACWSEPVWIDTYATGEPDRYPMFLDRRVYQGSSGKVYPLPFIDSVAVAKEPRLWRAIHLENEFVRLMLLPEIGGRIHVGYDKTADYDFFYRNNVIKPALVGLAGPWISGGVEFNWPQHHRPATYLPVETSISRDPDGSVTVWHSDLDPLQRMQGNHGVTLRPGKSLLEVQGRLHNRTDEPQTFLWWANVAARVHEHYQSFFPTDVRYVADHARRAITAFPHADRPYYGVDYPALAAVQPGSDRVDFYSNVPVPTSYMITDTQDSFFGGYDHLKKAGFVHWADRAISPGKKQWTWGDGPVGHAWDGQLTDDDGPYVELMAGVFTDNQPDFSYLAPGETRRFSQYWYPIREMGPAQQANLDAAVSLRLEKEGTEVHLGASATRNLNNASVVLSRAGRTVLTQHVRLSPTHPFTGVVILPTAARAAELTVDILEDGKKLISWTPREITTNAEEPWIATEPPHPEKISSTDELYVTGLHLTQNRHATRSPLPYFEEILRRDPHDSRAAVSLGTAMYRQGRYVEARELFQAALSRLTRRNLNPATGEAGYWLGLVEERLGHFDEARKHQGKAAWDAAWAHPAQLALARMSLRTSDYEQALLHAKEAIRRDALSPAGHALQVMTLRRLGRAAEAESVLRELLLNNPLDPLALALDGRLTPADPKTALTIASDFARAGQWRDALDLTAEPSPAGTVRAFGATEPLRRYLRAAWLEHLQRFEAAAAERTAARGSDTTLAFPYGLDDYDALKLAIVADPHDEVAHSLMGCWLLDARRTGDAYHHLHTSTTLGSTDPSTWRNTAIAAVNLGRNPNEADTFLDRALHLSPNDPRLVFERAVLAQHRGVGAAQQLESLERHGDVLLERHDLALLYANLLVDVGRVHEALGIMTTRIFQPFEGGEGLAIAAYDRASLQVARDLLTSDPTAAVALLRQGMAAPPNLGEGRHPANSMAERLLLLGDALSLAEDHQGAAAAWQLACRGDNSAAPEDARATPADFWRGIAFARLGLPSEANRVWDFLSAGADDLETEPSGVEYFATSVPELLLFDTDTTASRARTADRLRELAAKGRAGLHQGARP